MATIWAISDVHADFPENEAWVRELDSERYGRDALLVAGDVSHDLQVMGRTLATLRAAFARVFFVPGNHELWLKADGAEVEDSLVKLGLIHALCRRLGVEVEPGRVGGVWVVPLLSWYDEAFAGEESVPRGGLAAWADFRHCRWPFPPSDAARHLRELNAPFIRRYDGPVVSFSHFVPRSELVPGQDHLRFKALPLVSGDPALDFQVRAVGAVAHVFGHTHINRDVVIDGVHYIQSALRYPRERSGTRVEPFMVMDAGQGA